MSERMSLQEISQQLSLNTEHVATLLLNETPRVEGNTLRFGARGGTSVYLNGPKRGRWINFADDGPDARGDLLDLIRVTRNVDTAEAIRIAKDLLGHAHEVYTPPVATPTVAEDAAKRVRAAKWLWSMGGAVTPSGVAYLASRGLTVPAHVRGRTVTASVLRDTLKIDTSTFGDRDLDVVVFPLILPTGAIQGVQQIFVLDGKKAPISVPKRSKGVLEGAAARFGRGARVVVCEGPETGLSIHQATGLPVRIGTGRVLFPRIQLEPEVQEVLIAIDDDEPGRAAGAIAEAAYQAQGKRTRLITPPVSHLVKPDFNDILVQLGADAVRAAFADA